MPTLLQSIHRCGKRLPAEIRESVRISATVVRRNATELSAPATFALRPSTPDPGCDTESLRSRAPARSPTPRRDPRSSAPASAPAPTPAPTAPASPSPAGAAPWPAPPTEKNAGRRGTPYGRWRARQRDRGTAPANWELNRTKPASRFLPAIVAFLGAARGTRTRRLVAPACLPGQPRAIRGRNCQAAADHGRIGTPVVQASLNARQSDDSSD